MARALYALVAAMLVMSTSAFVVSTAARQGLQISSGTARAMVDRPVPRATSSSSAGALTMRSLADRNTATVDLSTAPVTRVTTSQEYHALLAENPESLVVFKWFAPWCRSCKAMDLKFKRLALENPCVVFAEIDIDVSRELKRQHGVKAIPAIHMHAGHLGLVENFTCGPSKVLLLSRRINMYANVAAYVAKAKGGLMEKLSAFSAGVASKLPIPSAPIGTASKGLMERFNDLSVIGESDSDDSVTLAY
eukprot:TRINITY_DN7323_c3_g1_i2.p1 TRINITY_DN7323_c3_g1~~TRINITY_DN7323_c3_g1_i2.p1  ORF type:complete len:249 (-),score=68.63 TRINITY_DN7323_c3_g1_i2:528-1274(-)